MAVVGEDAGGRGKVDEKDEGVWMADIVGETGDVEGERPGLDMRELERRRSLARVGLLFDSIAMGWEGFSFVGVGDIVWTRRSDK